MTLITFSYTKIVHTHSVPASHQLVPDTHSVTSFPGGSYGKESAWSAGDPGLISGSGRSPGEGNGSPLQYSCLENPMDRRSWQAIVHRVTKSQTWLSDFTKIANTCYYLCFVCLFVFDSESKVTQSCLILCEPVDCSPSGSSVHGILQARILEWVAISFSRGSSQPRGRTQVSCITGRFFTIWATWEVKCKLTSTSQVHFCHC